MRTLLYISLFVFAAAGCTHLTAPDQNVDKPLPRDADGYFWKNTTATYRYAVTGSNASNTDSESIQVTLGNGGLTATTQRHGVSDPASAFTAAVEDGKVVLNALSTRSFLSLDPGTYFTSDPNPTNRMALKVSAIMESMGELFAATDSGFYHYDVKARQLVRQSSTQFPSNVTALVETFGSPPSEFYAVDKAAGLFWISHDRGKSWQTVRGIPGYTGPIAAVAADNDLYAAVGSELWRLQKNATNWIQEGKTNDPSDKIISIDAHGVPRFGTVRVIFGTSKGYLYVGPAFGKYGVVDTLYATGVNEPVQFVRVNSSNDDLYAGTGSGLYSRDQDKWAKEVSGVISAVSEGRGLFVGTATGDVWDVTDHSKRQRVHSVGERVLDVVLADTQIFVLTKSSLFCSSDWKPLPQTVPSQAGWQPGGLTVLDSGTFWIAGTLVRTSDGKIFTYRAYASVVSKAVLEGRSFEDVAIVRYEPDFIDAPSYAIYYQRGVGPIRLERTEAGVTSTTQFIP